MAHTFKVNIRPTPQGRVLSEKLILPQLVKKFSTFCAIQLFCCHIHKSPPLFLSWVRPMLATPTHPLSWRFIQILSSKLYVGLPSGLFLSRFATKTVYPCLLPLICHIPHPSHSWFVHPSNIWCALQVIRLPFMLLFPPPVTCSQTHRSLPAPCSHKHPQPLPVS
jgi:hypothetical protein